MQINLKQSAAASIGFFVVWAIYFYSIDWLLMSSQGLPVGPDLMPAM